MPSSLYEDASPAKRKERFDKLKKRSDALLQESISDYQGGAMRQKMALLEDSGYLCLGDQFVDQSRRAMQDKTGVNARYKGNQFLVTGSKRGKVGDGCYFSEFVPLCVGDTYVDPSMRNIKMRKALERKRRIAERTRLQKKFVDKGKEIPSGNILERASFKPSSKKLTRGGDGPFLSIVDADTDAQVIKDINKAQRAERAEIRKEVPVAPRQIQTNPVKKGGYGVPGTTLSERTEWGKNLLKYMPEGDGKSRSDREAAAKARLIARKEIEEAPKWRPSSGRKKFILDACFDLRVNTRASRRRRPSTAGITGRKKKEEDDEKPPWIPNRHKKSSIFDACLNPFPEHQPDPVPIAVRRRKAEEDENAPPGFRPSSAARSRPVRTIAVNKKNLGVFNKNFFLNSRRSVTR